MLAELKSFYTKDQVEDIFLYIRLIYLGNLSGNTFDGFVSRLKGKPPIEGHLPFEIYFFLVSLLFIAPIFVPITLISKMRKKKQINSIHSGQLG